METGNVGNIHWSGSICGERETELSFQVNDLSSRLSDFPFKFSASQMVIFPILYRLCGTGFTSRFISVSAGNRCSADVQTCHEESLAL